MSWTSETCTPLRNNQWLYFRYMCTDGTLETVMRAEKQGYDAVFISCNLDIGLYEARQLVDIPVTATLESAALVAHMMGATYSLVTVDYQNGKIQESLVQDVRPTRALRLSAPVRHRRERPLSRQDSGWRGHRGRRVGGKSVR